MLNQRVACDLVTNFEVAENRIEYQTENLLIFFARTENQMLKYGKSANRNEYQNQKTEFFGHKNRKTDLKIAKTARPKIPMPPSMMNVATYLYSHSVR